jgi:hypothetical protein
LLIHLLIIGLSPPAFGISQNQGDTRCIPNDLFLRLGAVITNFGLIATRK